MAAAGLSGHPASATVTAWVEPATVEVVASSAAPGPTDIWDGDAVTIRGAKGEWESFQIVVRSETGRLVALEVYDLEGPYGRIAANNFGFYREVPEVTTAAGEKRRADALLPVRTNFTVPAGGQAVIWCELFIPPEARAGKYEGLIKLKWSGGERPLAVNLTVWDFAVRPLWRFVAVGELNEDAVKEDAEIGAGKDEGGVIRKYLGVLLRHGVLAANLKTTYEELLTSVDRRREIFDLVPTAELVSAFDYQYLTGSPADRFLDGTAAIRAGGARIRALGWACWACRARGVLLKDLVVWPLPPATGVVQGLVYPASAFQMPEPVASIELKLLREAAEDYEYMAMLADAGMADYADELSTALLVAAEKGLDAVGGLLPRAREAAALALVKASWGQGVARNPVEGVVLDDAGTPVAGAVVSAGVVATVAGEDGRYKLNFVPRGVPLVAEAPGYNKAGAAGAAGRGDFYLKRLFRKELWGGRTAGKDYEARGWAELEFKKGAGRHGGVALEGRLKGKEGRFTLRVKTRDWRTFGALVVEVFNAAPRNATAKVLIKDGAGAIIEEEYVIPAAAWRTVRTGITTASRAAETSAVNWADVREITIIFNGAQGGTFRLGDVWLEALAE